MADFCGNETDRAAILALYDLDAEGFGALDEITDFAAALCETPIALVSIVETERQRFLARKGLEATETPRSMSFCAHAMLGEGAFVIPDATLDPRFADNALVTAAPHIRFYAGAPLISHEGVPLGALCVIDSKPRDGLTPLQVQGLMVLAKQVVAQLEARRREHHVSSWAQDHAIALSDSETKFRTLADAMPQMVWSTLPDGYHDYYNARWYEFTGMPEGSTDGEGWNGMFHPDDQDRAWGRWRQSLETGEPYEIEYRLRHHSGAYRWTLGRAMPLRDAAGRITRWFGTCTDIHEQRQMAEQREIVSHELSHRIKNIFSVIAGLIGLSAREHPEIGAVAEELRERVMSLGRAHDYVRPHSSQSASNLGQNSLLGILTEIFAPYILAGDARVVITGDDVEIDDRSATPLALLFHELATNAAKYGALSRPEGTITLHVEKSGDSCHFLWRERGGPEIAAAGAESFGTRLISLSAERQLGGTISRDWAKDGLSVSLDIPLRSMNRKALKTE
ncbi:PAS domain-containing protein [Sphingobium phenoxybenzoativorans]|uniref:histidine kinase n=1 Tax=Sphingobium phenoxybenzoativorans TaxID=1592790 RepID=A0A975K5L8_9SPHN|nr:PAS domain-containing protein [Sphingobium phenoxybenzoativorans]QUT05236.1 PAS domain-containing protein [Sphingobium phenoxybenzoativorans]